MQAAFRWLYRYSILVSGATLLLILAGGLVTSHEAGLAVPDWPLSYGQWMPPMVGNVFWEHGHRMIAGTVGILTLILTLWAQFSKLGSLVKKLAWIALAAVILQAVLGGLTVIYMLPPPISISHACLGQTFFCLLIAIAYYLKKEMVGASATPFDVKRPFYSMMVLNTSFIYVQLILGATVRHTGSAVLLHILGAFIVIGHVFRVVRRIVSDSTNTVFYRLAVFLGSATVIQLFLGIGAFMYTQVYERGYAPPQAEVLFASAHQTTGAIILATSFLMTLMAYDETESNG